MYNFNAVGDVAVQDDCRQHTRRLRQDETSETKSVKVCILPLYIIKVGSKANVDLRSASSQTRR